MDDRERVLRILEILLEEFPDLSPPLEYNTPFQFLVAVILSAQTTDAGVNRITPELFSRYPGPAELSSGSLEDLQRIIRPIGFANVKSSNIRKTAARILDNHGGRVPEAMDSLLALPGVGRKTAHVIRANLFGKPGIIVDTHFSRVMFRLGFCETRDPLRVERSVAALVPEEYWSKLSMSANFHGRKFCKARAPLCGDCPISGFCPSAVPAADNK